MPRERRAPASRGSVLRLPPLELTGEEIEISFDGLLQRLCVYAASEYGQWQTLEQPRRMEGGTLSGNLRPASLKNGERRCSRLVASTPESLSETAMTVRIGRHVMRNLSLGPFSIFHRLADIDSTLPWNRGTPYN